MLLCCYEFLPAETSRLWFTGATLRPAALMSCLFLLLFLKCHRNIPLPGNISVELWQGGCTTTSVYHPQTWLWLHFSSYLVEEHMTLITCSCIKPFHNLSVLGAWAAMCYSNHLRLSQTNTRPYIMEKHWETKPVFLFFFFFFNPPCVFSNSGPNFDQYVFAWGGNSLFWQVLSCCFDVH